MNIIKYKSAINSDINNDLSILIENHPAVKSYKKQSKALCKSLKIEYQNKNRKDYLTLCQCQDLIAQSHGYKHWHEFYVSIKKIYENKDNSLPYILQKNCPIFNSGYTPIKLGYNEDLGLNAWLDQKYLQNQCLIQGDKEKSNQIELSMLEQLIKDGKHVVYMDGCCDEVYTEKIKQIAIKCGREKDIRTISFMTNYSKYQKTNWYLPTSFPFSSGSLTEMFVSILAEKYKNSNNEYKELNYGRIISLLASVNMLLVYLRDNENLVLDFSTITQYLLFDKLFNIYKKRKDLPDHITASLKAYFMSLPGFKENEKIPEITLENHGAIQMDISYVLTSLESGYRHLLKENITTQQAYIKLEELIGFERNLIFIVTFPDYKDRYINAISVLPKFFLSILSSSLAMKMGRSLEYSKEDIKKDNSIHQKSYLFVNHCPLIDGFLTLPSNLKSLGMSVIFSYKNFHMLSEEQKNLINKNTATKIIIENSDVSQTSIAKNNKIRYKLLIDQKEENIIL